jgi:ribosomal subunit interface protein
MQIQVNTDNHTEGRAALVHHVEAAIESALERFGNRVTRVEVHLVDQNSQSKAADNDKRCTLEARLAGLQPITVSHESSTMDQAVDGAIDKLERTLDRTLDRRDNPRSRTSFGGDQRI